MSLNKTGCSRPVWPASGTSGIRISGGAPHSTTGGRHTAAAVRRDTARIASRELHESNSPIPVNSVTPASSHRGMTLFPQKNSRTRCPDSHTIGIRRVGSSASAPPPRADLTRASANSPPSPRPAPMSGVGCKPATKPGNRRIGFRPGGESHCGAAHVRAADRYPSPAPSPDAAAGTAGPARSPRPRRRPPAPCPAGPHR